MKAELTITDGCACSADQVQAKLNAVSTLKFLIKHAVAAKQ